VDVSKGKLSQKESCLKRKAFSLVERPYAKRSLRYLKKSSGSFLSSSQIIILLDIVDPLDLW